ncbi:MAG: hypothetical protein OEZ68_18340 [Gammaproteobacteria bacterium]|nr:hypothetical protein [Gammaproteobacteria bacterium]MDH5802766.1 hypothetical protein [Gammaproteobacteria bacterium]
MRIKIVEKSNGVVVYREKYGVMVVVLLLAMAFLGFGITFIKLAEFSWFPVVFGGFFTAVGLYLICRAPGYFLQIKKQGGAILLSADKKGLNLSPILNMEPVHYAWAEIERIVLTEKFRTKENRKRSFSWNLAIIYIKRDSSQRILGLLERSRMRVWKSPQGFDICSVDVPPRKLDALQQALLRFSGRGVEISVCPLVLFDYISGEERLEC